MRILFFNTNSADYVADGLFHGLRSILGADCVDVPRHDCMYRPLNPYVGSQLRGHGFTLYGLLEDSLELGGLRYFWEKRLHEFDLAVIADVWRQWPLIRHLSEFGIPLALVDGSDSPRLFPYARTFLGKPEALRASISRIPYFKRELFDDKAAAMGMERLPSLARLVPLIYSLANLHPISCSVPESKVRPIGQPKRKLLPRHIVDPDVAALFGDGGTAYAFTDEASYFDDLASSRFGITVKRAGWDALRHYEVAAAGAVPCFRDLNLKPRRCAPLGLDESNCIIYSDAAALRRRLEMMGDDEYACLAAGAHSWALAHTTRAVAQQFLSELSANSTNLGSPS